MKKCLTAIMLIAALCMGAISAQASQKLNIYMDKEALLSHDVSSADIRIRPEGMVRVTRHSLWPWDDEGAKWSMFVELENTSQGNIVIDVDWLVACRANRDEIAAAEYMFNYTTNIIRPGEKTMLYAGAYPYVQAKRNNADVSLDVWDVEGMEDFAGRIRQAEILRVRLDTRVNATTQSWPAAQIAPKVWIDGRMLCFEWTNETGEEMGFRSIGAIVSDKEGRIIDVIRETYNRRAVVAPGGTLSIQKEIAPYVTQGMIDSASFEAFAYGRKEK